jgi:hypothetical protein
MFRLTATILWLLLSATINSLHAADGKYCASESKQFDLHLFGVTYSGQGSTEGLAKRGVTQLKNSFARSDRVRIFSHKADGFSITFDKCVPGCPEAGAVEKFFAGSCSEQVARKDRLSFEKSFAVEVLKNFVEAEKSVKYDVFSLVQQLNDVYKASNKGEEVYAVISLIPHGVSPKDRKTLNAKFREAREKLAFPKDRPAVKIIGAATDSELIEFWDDVLRGRGDKPFQFVAF